MKETICQNKIKFKVFSLEWMNFFGFPNGILFTGLLFIFFSFKESQGEVINELTIGISITVLSLILYIIQLNKLKFEVLDVNTDLDVFKEKLKVILLNNNWEIRYDNQKYLQANFKGGVFNHDMITIVYGKNLIKLNVIFHPHIHNPLGAMFSFNKKGKRLIRKIKSIL